MAVVNWTEQLLSAQLWGVFDQQSTVVQTEVIILIEIFVMCVEKKIIVIQLHVLLVLISVASILCLLVYSLANTVWHLTVKFTIDGSQTFCRAPGGGPIVLAQVINRYSKFVAKLHQITKYTISIISFTLY